jgi:hypothetical protein
VTPKGFKRDEVIRAQQETVPDEDLQFLRAKDAEKDEATAAGDTVLHDRFGEGVVVTVSGRGHDAEAVIRFEDQGRSACCWPTPR